MTQRFLAAHPRCPLRGHRVYETKHRCDTPLISGPPIGGLLHFSVSFRFLPSSTPSPLRGPLPLKGTQEFVPMKRSYHFYSYHSAELATYGGQSSRDYSSLSHHRTYRSVYGGSILWAGIYSCLPFLPLPENHTQHSFSYLRQFRYFPTGSQSFDCILLQRMNVPFTVYFDRNRSVLPAFAVL